MGDMNIIKGWRTRGNELDGIQKSNRTVKEEEDTTITFKCIDCGHKDEVPDFVMDEFACRLKKREEVATTCPHCHGTMRQMKNVSSD